MALEVATPAGVSDAKAFQAGVRQLTYSEKDGALRLFVNGRRFVARGGNWGFPRRTCATAAASTTSPCATTAT